MQPIWRITRWCKILNRQLISHTHTHTNKVIKSSSYRSVMLNYKMTVVHFSQHRYKELKRVLTVSLNFPTIISSKTKHIPIKSSPSYLTILPQNVISFNLNRYGTHRTRTIHSTSNSPKGKLRTITASLSATSYYTIETP